MADGDSEDIARRLADFMNEANRPQSPLGPAELIIIRQMIQERANASWLRKKIFTYSPHVAAFVAGAWALFGWIQAHWKTGP